EKGGIAAAKQKHDVIMTPNTYLYLDYHQANLPTEPLGIGGYLPLEKVYSYEPYPSTLSAEEKKYIKGVQGNVWTEYIADEKGVDYFAYPRALALAEIAWSPASKKNYAVFTRKLEDALKDLDKRGVNFRIPEAAGAEDLVLSAAKTITLRPVSGGKIYYTLDGTQPSPGGKLYTKPFVVAPAVNKTVTLKYIVVLPSGRSSAVYTNTYTRKPYKPAKNVNPTRKGVQFAVYAKTFVVAKQTGAGRPDSSGTVPDFSLRPFNHRVKYGVSFEGYIKIDVTGLYEFSTTSDDGSVLAIDGEVIVDNDGEHASTEKTGMTPLVKGYHKIRVQYFNAGGEQQLQVGFGLKGKQSINLRNVLFH
ncbi:MAG: family 20 glycosylhydrolase, partial [Chitinophaga sp.]